MYKNPMSKQPFKPNLSKLPPRLPPYINRTIIPTKEIDPSIISTLLLKVSTDEVNILELGNFIMSNGITTNDMLNEDGESILHIIISNENLSQKKKLDLIKYLDSNFTLLSSFDKNGKTPLHLAVQNQLYDIVVELINAGHDINASDNTYKTPLHYAVIGKNTEPSSKIDKPLIPDKKIKIKSTLIQDLTENLVNFMRNDDFVKAIFNNQYHTLYNSQYLFPKEINEKLNSSNITDQIIKILQNPTLTKDKQNKLIFEISADVNKSIQTLILTKLDNVKKEIKLESNTENGWGPNNNLTDKIIPDYDYNKILNNKKNEIIEDIKQKLNENLQLFDINIVAKLDKFVESIERFTRLLLFTSEFYEQMNDIDDGTGVQKFNNINSLLIDYARIIQPFLFDQATPNILYNPNITANDTCDLIANTLNGRAIAGTDFDIQPIQNMDINITVPKINNFLTDFDNDPTLINRLNSRYVGDPNGDNTINTTNLKGQRYETRRVGAYNQYTTKRIRIFYNLIARQINELKQNINNLNTKIKTENPANLFNNNVLFDINNIIINIMNITNTLPKIFKEYDNIIIKLKQLFNSLTFDSNNIRHDINGNGNNYDVSILYKYLKETCKNFMDEFSLDEKKFKQESISPIKNIYFVLNKIVDYINLTHSIKYIKQYFNNFVNPENRNTDNLENMYCSQLNKLPDYFKTYDDILLLIKDNNELASEQDNKKKLIEKYLIQFNKFNLVKYIDTIGSGNVRNGRNGYLATNNLPILGYVNILNLDANISVKFDDLTDNTYYNYTASTPADKTGLVQIEAGKNNEDKGNSSLPIVSRLFDDFLNIQKYLITKHILQKIYDEILSIPRPRPRNNNLELGYIIDKFNEAIQNTVKPQSNDNSILLISIAKLIDKIFLANMENIVNITTNDFGYRIVRGLINPTDEYNIINITQLNKLNIHELNFDDIQKSIIKLFKKYKKMSLYNYAEDIMVKQMKDKNVYKIMSSNVGNTTNEYFYKYNADILKKLLESGGSLNVKDKDGNTPLMIALLQYNDSAVKYILEDQQFQNISVYNKDSKNRFGVRPFDICSKALNVIIDNFDDETSNKNLVAIMKEVNDKISNITRIKHNMRFHNVILRMLIYLLNHDFYSMLNSYKFQSDNNFHNYFFNNITKQIQYLPLLQNVDQIMGQYHKYINTDIINREEINKLNKDKKDMFDKENTLLENEVNQISPPTVDQQYRQQEIIDRIKKNKEKLEELEPPNPDGTPSYELNKTNTLLRRQKTRNDVLNRNFINKLKTKNIESVSDILQIYDDVVNKILEINNDDYRTYMTLWEELFKTQDEIKATDVTQVINKIFTQLNDVLKKSKKNIKTVDPEVTKNITFAIELLTKHINDYFELPYVYEGDNYVLDRIVGIFEHIIKNTMLVNLYHIVQKLIRVELASKLPNVDPTNEDENNKTVDENVIKIVTAEINGISIKKYIFEILPKKIIKNTLSLYENDEDDDKSTTLVNLLEYINKLLEPNIVISITKDDKIIRTLNEYVYPYFKDYIDINLKMMKKLTDTYLSMIISLNPKLNMFNLMIKKAITEK